jgi:hypothetical protein
LSQVQEIADRVSGMLRLLGCPEVRVKVVERGRAHTDKGYFTLPGWATLRHPAFLTAYIIHELCHFGKPLAFVSHGAGPYRADGWALRKHGAEFRSLEQSAASMFGLRLEYRGSVYLSAVRDLQGNLVCDGFGRSAETAVIDYQI